MYLVDAPRGSSYGLVPCADLCIEQALSVSSEGDPVSVHWVEIDLEVDIVRKNIDIRVDAVARERVGLHSDPALPTPLGAGHTEFSYEAARLVALAPIALSTRVALLVHSWYSVEVCAGRDASIVEQFREFLAVRERASFDRGYAGVFAGWCPS